MRVSGGVAAKGGMVVVAVLSVGALFLALPNDGTDESLWQGQSDSTEPKHESTLATSMPDALMGASVPRLDLVDESGQRAVIGSSSGAGVLLRRGDRLPEMPWRLAAVGPDFVDLDSLEGGAARLRVFLAAHQAPHRLIHTRFDPPTSQRLILLPLVPETLGSDVANNEPEPQP